jgi:phospholipid/cholesterol/gamma-HCH transport system substrate-binding protein
VQLTSKTGFGHKLSGAALFPDGATVPESRTAVPLELDEIYGSLSQFSAALGPQGANAPGTSGQGALTRLLDTTARNFGGQGVNFNHTIQNLGRLSQTLSDNKGVLFGTQTAVEKFVKALATNDSTVRAFTQSLTEGASMLASDRQDLANALDNLATALDQVRSFVADNKTLLTSNIAGLTRISETLVKRRNELAEILKVAPLALNNLALAYNAKAGTLDTRANVGQSITQLSASPGKVLCAFYQIALQSNAACPFAALGRAAFDQVRQAQQANRQSADLTLGGLVAP